MDTLAIFELWLLKQEAALLQKQQFHSAAGIKYSEKLIEDSNRVASALNAISDFKKSISYF